MTSALRPFSHADAGRRIYDAVRPLRTAGIPAGAALATVAAALRSIVSSPMAKGDVSTRLTAVLPEPYLRWCAPCHATHIYEMTFRLGALHAGLEIVPGTSPPVLRPVEGWSSSTLDQLRDLPATAETGTASTADVPEHLDPVRAGLHLLGPTTPADVAGYLDAPPADVRVRWRALEQSGEITEVDVDGQARSLLSRDLDTLVSVQQETDRAPVVRLVGGYDLFVQARDRALVVPDRARHRSLWPTLGRPGAVLVDGEVAGIWRPRAAGRRLTVRTEPWAPWDAATDAAVDDQVQLLGRHRGAGTTSRV